MAVIFSLNVNALSVVSDYLENDTLLLVDGTSKLYSIRLQNPSSEAINLQLTYDDTTAKVIDYEEIYTVPPKTNKAIFFNISTPPDSKPDDTYIVSYTVHQLSGSGPSLPILLKINKNFKLKITKDPNKFYISDYYPYIPNVVIILIIILFLFRKKFMKKGTSKKKTKKIIKNRKIIK